jgi:CDGSH-type Zn-finger protein
MSGKGSRPRPFSVDQKTFDTNWDLIFLKDKKMEEKVPCGCGRSSTGYCTGLHEMTEEEYESYLLDHFDEDSDRIGN